MGKSHLETPVVIGGVNVDAAPDGIAKFDLVWRESQILRSLRAADDADPPDRGERIESEISVLAD